MCYHGNRLKGRERRSRGRWSSDNGSPVTDRSGQFIQIRDLSACNWPGKKIHCPARQEKLRLFCVDVMQNENTFTQRRYQFIELIARKPACRAFESIQQSVFILLRLKFANEPGASIGESFVIHIYRVLCGEQETQAKGTRLLQHTQQRLLGRRIALRWHIAEYLIHVEQSTQGCSTALSAHPGFNRGQ